MRRNLLLILLFPASLLAQGTQNGTSPAVLADGSVPMTAPLRTPGVLATPNSSYPGVLELPSNTSIPPLGSGGGLIGANAAAGTTSVYFRLPATPPTASERYLCADPPVDGISQLTSCSAVSSASGTGSGSPVLQSAPTINNAILQAPAISNGTLSSPSISGVVTTTGISIENRVTNDPNYPLITSFRAPFLPMGGAIAIPLGVDNSDYNEVDLAYYYGGPNSVNSYGLLALHGRPGIQIKGDGSAVSQGNLSAPQVTLTGPVPASGATCPVNNTILGSDAGHLYVCVGGVVKAATLQ